MPLISRKRVLAAKIEATPYTAIAVAEADATFNVFDPIIQPTIESFDRMSQGSFSYLPASSGLRSGTCTFRTEITGDGAGAGTVPAWASTFLPACGWVDVTPGTFAPLTDVPVATTADKVKTLTMSCYVDGTLKSIRGAVGTFVINLEAGKPAFIEFTFVGAWTVKSDTPILAPTYTTVLPFRFAASTISVSGLAPCIESCTIDAGNTTTLLPCQANADNSGYKGGIISARRPTITMNPESELVTTNTFVADWIASTQDAFTLTLTNLTDSFVISAPKLQPINVQEGERGGLVTDEVTFLCCKSAAGGDDELTFNFN